jgi:hypothetical protein
MYVFMLINRPYSLPWEVGIWRGKAARRPPGEESSKTCEADPHSEPCTCRTSSIKGVYGVGVVLKQTRSSNEFGK